MTSGCGGRGGGGGGPSACCGCGRAGCSSTILRMRTIPGSTKTSSIRSCRASIPASAGPGRDGEVTGGGRGTSAWETNSLSMSQLGGNFDQSIDS